MILYFVVHKLCQSTVMDRRYDFVLLLTVIASLLYSHNAGASMVGTAPTVRGWRGEDIRLGCDIQEEPLIVYWNKESFSNQEQRTPKATFNNGIFESREERFNIENDFSLVITNLEVADEGRYYCEVALGDLQTAENATLLTISSMASRHAIEECDAKSQSHQSRCTCQSTSNTSSFTLTCVVSGFKPNISMLWTDESGKRLDSVVSQQNTLFDGTYERFETISVSAKHATEQTFVCSATGDSLNGTSTIEITVLPVSGKRVNAGLIVGLIIGVPVAFVLLFLLVGKYLQNKHPDYLPRKGCGWNPCWKRPNIPESSHEEEDEMLRPSSLTKEQIQQCKDDLKACYRRSRGKVRVDSLKFMELFGLDGIHTNLSIIDRRSKNRIPITYGDLLINDGNLSKRLLIQGEGGVGKTTLCAKIAWDWCQGRILQDVDMLLLVPLRDVSNDKSIGGIAKNYLSDSNAATTKQIDDYISTNASRVLIIFDGLDDFNGKLSEKNSSQVIRVLGVEQYKSCRVIVTTRPWRTDEFMMDKSLADAYTYLCVEGFNEEDLSTYIRRYFRIREKDDLAENLIRFMDENDVIRSYMAPFPIYCAMLCLMWNDYSEERRKEMQNLQTFSNFFGEMISFLKEHYASKACENFQNQNVVEHLKEAGRAIQAISEIALNGLLDRKFSFPEEQFRKCHDAMETCRRVGVLTIESDVITRERRRDVSISSLVTSRVSFPHKLFQEYFAGLHIEHLFANDRAKYDKVKNELLSRHEEFCYLLYFTSSLGNELGLDIINDLVKCSDQYFCVDVAFECHTEEATRAVGERWGEYTLSCEKSEHTNSGVTFMVHCNQVRTLVTDGAKCGRTVSHDLAEGMLSSRVLRKVEISHSQFHTDFYKLLRGEEASKCQIQELKLQIGIHHVNLQNRLSTEGELAEWACKMPRLLKFSLECPCVPYGFLSTAATSTSPCKIEDLNMRFGGLKNDFLNQSSVGEDLANWVFAVLRLSKFTLRCPNLPNSFFSKAAQSVSSSKIRSLDLHFDGPPDPSPDHRESPMEEFLHLLLLTPHLSKFSLRCPYLPRRFLSHTNSASDCQIQDLEIYFDNPTNEPVIGVNLAKWMCGMPHLLKFSLRCPFSHTAFILTAADLASSRQGLKIRELSLGCNEGKLWWVFGTEATKLAELLCHLPNLERANLYCVDLPRTFGSNAPNAQDSKGECIFINGKPLTEFLSDCRSNTQTSSDGSGSEDRISL